MVGESDKYSFVDGVLTITGNVSVSTSSETDDVIVVNGGNKNTPIEVTLNGINISSTKSTPITIASNSFVKLILTDGSINSIKGGENTYSENEVISLNTASLEISGNGSLNVEGEDGIIGDDNNSSVTISGGKINIHFTGKSNHYGIKSENVTISSGYVYIDGEGYGSGICNNFSTGENGNALIVVNADSNRNFGYESNEDKKKNRKLWNGIILENQHNKKGIEGYVYGNVILDQDIEIKEGWKLNILDSETESPKLDINEKNITNNGNIYLTKSNESLVEAFGEDKCYHEISFEEDVPEGIAPGDAWSSKYVMRGTGMERKIDYISEDTSFFAKSGSQIVFEMYLVGGGAKDNQNRYAGYNLISSNIVKENGQAVIASNALSFTMPSEPVFVKDLKVQRKTFALGPILFVGYTFDDDNEVNGIKKIDPIEGLDVHFENAKGEIITDALFREKIYLVLKPKVGYKIESIAHVTRKWGHLLEYENTNYGSAHEDITLIKDEEKGFYYEEIIMPQIDVDVYVYDNYYDVWDSELLGTTKVVPIDYNLTVSPTPSNGTITFGEDGTQVTANYQEQVQVNVTPAEGYHVVRSSLYYTAEGSDEQIPISLTNGVYSFTMPAADVTVHAEFAEGAEQWYLVSVADSEHGTVSADPIEAKAGETINLTITPDEGYLQKELYYIANGSNEPIAISGTSFEMPAADVTVYATFEKIQDDQPGPIVKPIKYYNIYVDTICPGLNVEVSKDVVQEGHQVSAYLTIQAECDTTGMRFEYKRGLFGYWKDLKELEGVQPGEYIIKNIYTDIYIRALDATLPEEEPTGIEDLEGVKAYAKDGSIYVYTPNREEVTIISMSGTIIKHEEQVGLQSYSVNRGIYIVRIGEKVFKLKN